MTGDPADAAALLAHLPDLAFAFVLVLSRVGFAVALLPGLGESEPAAMLRAGLALAITALLLPGVAPLVPDRPVDVGRMAAMVGAELLYGGVLGWLARLVALSLPVAGALVATFAGLASVLQPDPAQSGQATAIGRLFGIVMPVLVLSTGLYALPLQALAGSYRLVAPGAWLPAGDAAQTVLGAVAEGFGLALQLAAPFLLAGLVSQAALGLLARLVPQMQVYALATPLQILGGLVLLGLLATGMVDTWSAAVRAGWSALPGL